MRAIFVDNQPTKDLLSLIEVTNGRHHHISRVVRIKEGEQILVFFGGGYYARAVVHSVEKKKTILNVERANKAEDKRFVHLIIGNPKKELFENIVKIAIECGIKKMSYFESERSPKLKYRSDRLVSLCESAMIQSNNPYGLEINELGSFEEALEIIASQESAFLLSPSADNGKSFYPQKKEEPRQRPEEKALIIGPEGGFTQLEEDRIVQAQAQRVCLGDYILRAPTAVAVGMGFVCAAHGE